MNVISYLEHPSGRYACNAILGCGDSSVDIVNLMESIYSQLNSVWDRLHGKIGGTND